MKFNHRITIYYFEYIFIFFIIPIDFILTERNKIILSKKFH